LSCDRAFRDRPAIFTAALRESAKNDENERVRAFSTRMLGKIGDPANADLFAKLLSDPSPYVRGNAAWAIGVVGTQHQHRAALERLARTDKVPLVRERATAALKTTTLAERGKPRTP
jgi:HEAT repeat protein